MLVLAFLLPSRADVAAARLIMLDASEPKVRVVAARPVLIADDPVVTGRERVAETEGTVLVTEDCAGMPAEAAGPSRPVKRVEAADVGAPIAADLAIPAEPALGPVEVLAALKEAEDAEVVLPIREAGAVPAADLAEETIEPGRERGADGAETMLVGRAVLRAEVGGGMLDFAGVRENAEAVEAPDAIRRVAVLLT